MKFFIDTNVVLEFLFGRRFANEVGEIFRTIENKENSAYISNGSFYTLTYLIDSNLKRQNFVNPNRLEKLRGSLNALLNLFEIVELNKSDFKDGVNDLEFEDLEDSYQYQSAKKENCDFLVTINTKDFPEKVFIVTPVQLLEKLKSNRTVQA